MRAIAITTYGDADVMSLQDLPEPLVGPDTVLVRVQAAGVNPVDTKVRAGYLQGAFPSHFPLVLGWDLAGVVEQVGPAVTEYAVGDEVLGYVRRDELQHGTYAELVPAPLRALAPKPAGVSWTAAGGLPLAGLTARQALDAAMVSSGDTVLIHAAAGGVGGLAVQLAVGRGARVIGTAGQGNHDYLRSLGAEPVTYGDGLAEAVRALAPDGVDAVLDLIGGAALAGSPSLVKDPARIVSIIDPGTVLGMGGRYVFVRPDSAQLSELVALVADGSLKVEIAHELPLDEAAKAHRLSEEGHVRGKIVLRVDQPTV